MSVYQPCSWALKEIVPHHREPPHPKERKPQNKDFVGISGIRDKGSFEDSCHLYNGAYMMALSSSHFWGKAGLASIHFHHQPFKFIPGIAALLTVPMFWVNAQWILQLLFSEVSEAYPLCSDWQKVLAIGTLWVYSSSGVPLCCRLSDQAAVVQSFIPFTTDRILLCLYGWSRSLYDV